MTTYGKFCAPGADSGGSCYTREQLLKIIDAYNAKYASKISTNGNKAQLWKAIDAKMDSCTNEWCWMETLGMHDELEGTFRAKRPVGKNQWLNTTDIRSVLKQYESVYPEFVFLGPVPLDFCSLAGNEVCNLNLKTSRRNGKTKIGIVFNTDTSDKPGKHWISMFIDISDEEPSAHEVGYFDSYGLAPVLPEIKKLVSNLQRQNPHIQVKMNCKDDICSRTVRHQMANTECGVYSINFIVTRLTGKTWEQTINDRLSDEHMTNMREFYFRPHKGNAH